MKKTGIILIVAIMLGLGYGHISAVLNQNPYYPSPGEANVSETDTAKAWHWQPSPVWLPSYLLCKVPRNGFGITHTRSGYLFRSEGNRDKYITASTTAGAFLGLVVGAIVAVVTRRKRQSVEPEH